MNERDSTVWSRGEFLRASMAGAAGAAAIVSTVPSEAAGTQARRGYVVVVTHAHADATRVMLALFTATRLPAGDNHVWFAIDGGLLCKKGEAEKVTSPLFVKQGSAAKLIEQIRDRGTAIHI